MENFKKKIFMEVDEEVRRRKDEIKLYIYGGSIASRHIYKFSQSCAKTICAKEYDYIDYYYIRDDVHTLRKKGKTNEEIYKMISKAIIYKGVCYLNYLGYPHF